MEAEQTEQILELIRNYNQVDDQNKIIKRIIKRLRNGRYRLYSGNIMHGNQIMCSYEELNNFIIDSTIDNIIISHSPNRLPIVDTNCDNFDKITQALSYDISQITDQSLFDKTQKPEIFSNLIIMSYSYYNLIMFISSLEGSN